MFPKKILLGASSEEKQHSVQSTEEDINIQAIIVIITNMNANPKATLGEQLKN
jgi:hypothetical protein